MVAEIAEVAASASAAPSPANTMPAIEPITVARSSTPCRSTSV